jgi:hypothetical protein
MIILEENEELLSIARKHWITYLGLFISHGLTLVIVIGVLFFIHTAISVTVIASLIWLVATSFAWFFITQYLDAWYITDKRIVAINQIELFNRTEAIILMNKIQDTQFKKVGMLQDMFGYGQLIVQSAGTEQDFVIENIAHVEQIASQIIEKKTQATQNVSVI